MSFAYLLSLIEEEAGAEIAARIERRARHELAGLRLTITKRRAITQQAIDQAAPGKPKEAARKMGVHPSTIYRIIQQRNIIR